MSFAYSFFNALKKEATSHDLLFYQPSRQKDLNTPRRIWWEAVELPWKAEHDKVDLIYSPGFSPPPRGNFKKVVTVHDLIGLIYPKNVRSISRWYWSSWLPQNIQRADTLVASSESTRRDLEKYLKIPASRIQVVPLAADPAFRKINDTSSVDQVLAGYHLKKPYILAVGTLEPRKNSLRLLQAFCEVSKKIKDLQLVFAGKDAGMEESLRRAIRENALEERVRLLGYVPDEDLVCLYNGALGYVMISLYEGFGLPALEAMACGRSGIVSRVSSLPEVVGDTALQVDPENTDEIAAAIRDLVSNDSLINKMEREAYERSKQFSYTKTARAMLNIFRKTVE